MTSVRRMASHAFTEGAGCGESVGRADQPGVPALLPALAGNETPATPSGGMLAFSDHPEQWQRPLGDPSLTPTAAEEMIRRVSPVNHIRRTATLPAYWSSAGPGTALTPRSLVSPSKRLPLGQQRLGFLRSYQPLSAYVPQSARA